MTMSRIAIQPLKPSIVAHGWRADIDGLRAIAVLSVLVFHAFPQWLGGGFIGVDVFFVISGYLITGIVSSDHRSGRLSMKRFYARRARRLFPALAAVLAATLLAVFLLASSDIILRTVKHSVAGALSAANLVLWGESGYFDLTSHSKPLLHLWSLGVEEQFYLVWPWLLAWLLSQRRSATAWLAAACILSLAFAELLNVRAHNAAFYSPLTRMWELGAGALLALHAREEGRSGPLHTLAASRWMCRLGLGLIGASVVWLDASLPLPGWRAVPAVVGSCLVLWSGDHPAGHRAVAPRLLCSRPMVYIGAISYPLYLWHWPLLAVPTAMGLSPSPWQTTGLLLAALLCAAATMHWLETPVRIATVARRGTVAACLMLGSALLLSGAVWALEQRARHSPQRLALEAQIAWPLGDPAHGGCPEALASSQPPLAFCAQNRPGPVTAVVWGDSHANQLYPGLAKIDTAHTWAMVGHPSCPPVVGIDVKADQNDCRIRSETGLRWIEQQASIETVVMGMFGHYGAADDVAFDHRYGITGPSRVLVDGTNNPAQRARLLEQGLGEAIDRLLAVHKQVVLVIDNAEFPFDPRACYRPARVQWRQPSCDVDLLDVLARQAAWRATVNRLAAQRPALTVFDPLPTLCVAQRCSVFSGAAPLYRDSHHLSLFGSERVAAALISQSLLSRHGH